MNLCENNLGAIAGLATANPDLYVSQEEAYTYLKSRFELDPEEEALYRRLMLEGPIDGRYFGSADYADICSSDPDALNARFAEFAVPTAGRAMEKALAAAGIGPNDVSGLVVNTCTGYLCPGLTSYLTEALSLPDSITVMDLMGMGCGGAIPNLQCAAALQAGRRDSAVVSVAVEMCSATFFRGSDPGLIVSNSIFGDGASAVVLGDSNCNGRRGPLLYIRDFETCIETRYREHLRYRTETGRLRNVLRKEVPVIGAKVIGKVMERLLGRNRLTINDIHWWAVHPGGTAVLDRVENRLGLSPGALDFSRHLFRERGNMSSPSVMFVLEHLLQTVRPASGQWIAALAFGAGFTGFGVLLRTP